jgi:serine/threonine protein kinase
VCECSSDTIEIGGECVPTGTFAAIISSVAVVIAMQLGWCYLRYRRRKNDEMWQVNHEELHFSHPVEVIGQGAFGVVLLAEYRGTKVAIKRVLPFQEKRTRSGSVASVGSVSKDATPEQEEKDIEKQSDGDTNTEAVTGSFGTKRASPTGTGSKSSTNDLDFLGGLSFGGKKTRLQRWLPLLFTDETTRYNLSILGTASGGSGTSRSYFARMCPNCDDTSRRQQEFMTEMRLLSRLRHPCEYKNPSTSRLLYLVADFFFKLNRRYHDCNGRCHDGK